MVVPSTSHDYKLCIFAAPVVLLLNSLNLAKSGHRWLDWAAIALVLLLTGAYSTTLFLHTDLPLVLTSNLPALLVIAAAAALLMAVRSRQAKLAGSADDFQDLNTFICALFRRHAAEKEHKNNSPALEGGGRGVGESGLSALKPNQQRDLGEGYDS